MSQYYVESDGQVYLVLEDNMWRFPAHKESLPFEVDELHHINVMGENVIFCKPHISYHPNWTHKDELMGWDNVHPLVRQAVNTSLARTVAEAIIVEEGKMLLVKSVRGFNQGRWSFPGGFISYGETPAEAVVREVNEEVGVEAEAGDLLGIESFIGKDTYIHWHMCFYDVKLLSHEFNPPADEIEDVRWFNIDEVLKSLTFKHITQIIKNRY